MNSRSIHTPHPRIAESCVIMSGAFVDDNVMIHEEVRIGPNAVVLGPTDGEKAETVIQAGALIGANATIMPGLVVGFSAVVGAGAVVTKNVPPYAVVVGNPAAIVRYQTDVTLEGEEVARKAPASRLGEAPGSVLSLGVGGCSLQRLPHFADLRGALFPLELGSDLPFAPRRTFLVQGVSNNKIRGEHAHRECRQFLIAVTGQLSVMIDDGRTRCEVELSDPSVGLDLAPMVWAVQYKFVPGSALLVFASHSYDADDYIRNYRDFRALVSDPRK